MVFWFSRKYKNVEREIEINVPADNRLARITLKEDGNEVDCYIEKQLFEFDHMVNSYNKNISGNKRDIFDNLFLPEYLDIAKVIGLINGYGHFFVFFNNNATCTKIPFDNAENIKGKTTVDWNVVSKKSTGPMAYYVTTDDESKCGRTELEAYYNQGRITKIHYDNNNKNGIIYCLDSVFMRTGSTSFIAGLCQKVDGELKKKFPNNEYDYLPL